MPCGATPDGRVMVERSDRMWSTGEGNGKPLQYSCLENPMLVPQSCLTICNPWTAIQAPLSMEFSSQGYCSGLPFPSPGDLPNPGIEPGSSALQADSLPTELPGKPMNSMRRPQVGRCQYATGDQWRNNSRKNEGMEAKQKQQSVVDGTGDRSKD